MSYCASVSLLLAELLFIFDGNYFVSRRCVSSTPVEMKGAGPRTASGHLGGSLMGGQWARHTLIFIVLTANDDCDFCYLPLVLLIIFIAYIAETTILAKEQTTQCVGPNV